MDSRPLDQRYPWILNPEPRAVPRHEIDLGPMDPSDVVEPDDSTAARR